MPPAALSKLRAPPSLIAELLTKVQPVAAPRFSKLTAPASFIAELLTKAQSVIIPSLIKKIAPPSVAWLAVKLQFVTVPPAAPSKLRAPPSLFAELLTKVQAVRFPKPLNKIAPPPNTLETAELSIKLQLFTTQSPLE